MFCTFIQNIMFHFAYSLVDVNLQESYAFMLMACPLTISYLVSPIWHPHMNVIIMRYTYTKSISCGMKLVLV